MPSKNIPVSPNAIAEHKSPDSERFILGAIMLDDAAFPAVAQILEEADFAEQKHRMIFGAMKELQLIGDPIDRMTLATILESRRELKIIELSYLAELDTGMPKDGYNVIAYARTVKEKSRLRKIIRHSRDTYNAAAMPDAMSGDIISKAQAGLVEIGDTLDTRGQMIGEYIAEYPGGATVMLDPAKWAKGVPTGFSILDDWTDGFHQSEIFLIGARPSVGKSSIGLNIARYLASLGNLSVFFSLEMSKQICLNRLICERAELSFQRFRRGSLTDDERRELEPATDWVKGLPIFIDDSSGLTTADIGMRLQSVANKQPVALCVIDYVQLLRGQKGKRYSTENERYEDIAVDLQNLSKRTGIPLLFLSQLNRESTKGADKRPSLSQCRGSGAWEQVANVGGVLFRESLSRPNRPELANTAELILEKNRGGPSGTINLRYEGPWMRFSDA